VPRDDLKIRRLEPADDRAAFHSGNIDLDRFFLRYAGQNQFRHHIGTTYVAIDVAGEIVGFATVSASEITPEALEPGKRKRLPKYPLPVLRLARLAVDTRVKGKGVGSALLRWVFLLAQRMAQDVGCVGVLVDAKDEAIVFYQKLGFVRLDTVAGELGDRPLMQVMFLELGQLG
jgi:GNAT superfamily N-acetyltransferase